MVDWVPTDDLNWMPHVAVVAVVVGLVEASHPDKAALGWVLRAGAALATHWLVLGFMIDHHWETGQAVAWLAGLTVATLAIIETLERVGRDHPGASVPAAATVLATGASLVMVMIGTAKVGQLLGGLAAAAGVSLVFAWWDDSASLSRGGATAFGLIFAGLVSFGYLSTADVPGWSQIFSDRYTLAALLVAASPFMLWVVQLPPLVDRPAWQTVLIRALLVALPLGAGVYLAANPAEEPTQERGLEGVDYDQLYQ